MDQDDLYANRPFGLISDVSTSGCGAVAIYNALVTLGLGTTFTEVLKHFTLGKNTILFGAGGSLPFQIKRYFTQRGYTVEESRSLAEIDKIAETADTCILWYGYTNSSFPWIGGHFVECSFASDGFLYMRNSYNDSKQYSSISDYCQYRGVICYDCIGIYK